MAIRLEDYVAKLPEPERSEVVASMAQAVEREATLRQLREARRQSQEELARKLDVKQAAVSRLERRADMYVSTLRKFVEAMGGELEITARFPGSSVKIKQFSDEK